MAANTTTSKGLTIRNTESPFSRAARASPGARGLVVKRCRFESIGRGICTDWSGSKDFYIADNVFIGLQDPSQPDRLRRPDLGRASPSSRRRSSSEFAVKVYGSGHVVAHNYVAQFPRRHRSRDLRQPGWHAERDSRPHAGVDRLLQQRHHERGRQLHRSGRRDAQHSHFPQSLLQSRPSRAQRAAGPRRPGLLHPQPRLSRARGRLGQIHDEQRGHSSCTTTR